MSAKQKIVHGRGPSNLNLGIFVCFFDVSELQNQSPVLTMPQESEWKEGKKNYFRVNYQ